MHEPNVVHGLLICMWQSPELDRPYPFGAKFWRSSMQNQLEMVWGYLKRKKVVDEDFLFKAMLDLLVS